MFLKKDADPIAKASKGLVSTAYRSPKKCTNTKFGQNKITEKVQYCVFTLRI